MSDGVMFESITDSDALATTELRRRMREAAYLCLQRLLREAHLQVIAATTSAELRQSLRAVIAAAHSLTPAAALATLILEELLPDPAYEETNGGLCG